MMQNKRKEIEHKKIERCMISNLPIDTDRDDYTILVKCRGDAIKKTVFYKTDDLNDLLHGNLEELNKRIMAQAQAAAFRMMQKMGLPMPEQTVDVSF